MSQRASLSSKRHLARRSFGLLSAAALAVLGAPGVAAADGGRPQVNPEEKAAALIRPAVLYFEAQAQGWVRLPSGGILPHFSEANPNRAFDAAWGCTAFTVNPDGWVATAGHCVDPDGAKDSILKHALVDYIDSHPDSPDAADPQGSLRWLRENARVEGATADRGPEISITLLYGTGTKVAAKMPANVVDFKPVDKGDVALLKVEKHNLPSSELATDAEVSIGTAVLSVGFPGSTEKVTDPSLEPTNKSGKVSKKSTMGTIPEYEIDAAVSHGMSGGPTIELNGKVIGINSFGPPDEPQAFNYIAPADGLAAVLAGKGVKAVLGPADVSYRKALDEYYKGQYTAAIKDFDQTLSMSPDYPGVADLKTNAVNLRAKYGDTSTPGGSKLLWYIVGGAALLLLVGGGALFAILTMSRKRRPVPAGAPGYQPGPSGPLPVGGVSGPVGPPAAPPVAPAPTEAPPQDSGAAQPAGVALAQPSAAEPHFCAGCGAEHHPDERFCPNCGKPVAAG